MDMAYDTMDQDRNIKTPVLWTHQRQNPKIHVRPSSGLLFATQFPKLALVVTEKLAFEDTSYKGFVQKDCVFASHSLGEYSGLRIRRRCMISCCRCLLPGYHNTVCRQT
jgi:malonyl CoA-acyl carrier protein transacylase